MTLINYGDNSLLGRRAKRHQQLWRRRAGLSRRPSQSESQSPQRPAVFQRRAFQRKRPGHSRQRLAPLLPWPRNGELRYGASQEPAPDANRNPCSSASKPSTSSITRSSSDRKPSTETSAAPRSARSSAPRPPPGPGGREVHLLMVGSFDPRRLTSSPAPDSQRSREPAGSPNRSARGGWSRAGRCAP